MTVRCPNCDTAYRLPPRSQLGNHPTFLCSQCDQVFDPEASAEEPALHAADDDAQPPDERDLDDDDCDSAAEVDDAAEQRAAPAGPSVGRFALRTMVGVTLLFALLSIYLFTHPHRPNELLARVPGIGSDLAATRLSPGDVQLTDVRGAYARVQGDALVFVVSGTAVNNAPVAVSAIELEARIVGTSERRRRAFAGAAPHEVDDLSEREIDLLQTLRPPKDWRLLPGEDGEFLVAFVEPPAGLREFSVEVATVVRREPGK